MQPDAAYERRKLACRAHDVHLAIWRLAISENPAAAAAKKQRELRIRAWMAE